MDKEWQSRVATVVLAIAGFILFILNALDLLFGWFVYPDGALAIVLGVVIAGALLMSRPEQSD